VANYATGGTTTPFRGFRGAPTTGPVTPFYTSGQRTNSTARPGNNQFDPLFGANPPAAGTPRNVAAPTNIPTPAGSRPGILAARPAAPPQNAVPPQAAGQSNTNKLPNFGIGLNSPTQAQTAERVPVPAAEQIPTPPAEQVPAPQAEQIPTPAAEADQRVEAKPEPQPRTAAEAMRPLSEQSNVPLPDETATPKPNRTRVQRPALATAPRAPIRHSDSERFSLDYELQAVGNLGVEAIELYGSVDGGESWELWGTDPDRISPFDIETKEEGLFSFRIVVVGRNGLASPRPQRGETPDIVVVVDKVKPQVRITAAQYGEGNRIGALVIRYECVDANLGPRPISLSFSDTTNGPWTTIAAGLRNDGDYVWPADPKLPRKIYLRIDCKDAAGNVGTYILDKPIDVQGLAPRAKIRGFQSLSGMEAFPVDEQTANRPRASFK
jgi:hypothetical protein